MQEIKTILIVDDDEAVLESLELLLETIPYKVLTAVDGIDALEKLSPEVELVMTDAIMPKLDGFDLIRKIRKDHSLQELPIIMVTGMTSRDHRMLAAEVGANDFISKPFDITEIKVRSASVLRMRDAHLALKDHKERLEETVAIRTQALRQTLTEMEQAQVELRGAYLDTINRLVLAAEYKDEGTAEHIQRMSRYCAVIAGNLDMPPREVELILLASPMHDIGKIGVPEDILLKKGQLDSEEWRQMKQHTLIGAKILHASSSDLLQAGEIIARSHHERWDGGGYPNGLSGEDIPLYGRICAVADVFDALTSKRSYKPAFSNADAIQMLQDGKGKHFDPKIVDVFIKNMTIVEMIQLEITS